MLEKENQEQLESRRKLEKLRTAANAVGLEDTRALLASNRAQNAVDGYVEGVEDEMGDIILGDRVTTINEIQPPEPPRKKSVAPLVAGIAGGLMTGAGLAGIALNRPDPPAPPAGKTVIQKVDDKGPMDVTLRTDGGNKE